MSYQVLARKWRPAKFEQMVGQSHVLMALTNALSQQRLHHAYLFTGTRGVGKTSLARLFAKGLNCETGVTANPCGECSSCVEIAQGRFVDLIEVDAASRTKVDDTRELLDNVQYRPSRGRFKVYLIDEVHMLSRSSFNALLKTLEEPPEHVKFLLATTDPHKLPVTVLSRCLQFNLKSLTQQQISQQLEYVITQEQLPFEPQALNVLAKAANGSMRDALSLTDQAIAFGSGQVMLEQVQTMLGSIDEQHVIALLKTLCDADVGPLMQMVAKVLAFGADAEEVLRSLLELLHQITLTQFAPAAAQQSLFSEQITAFAQQLSPEQVQLYYQMLLNGRKDLAYAPDPKSGLEMALLRAVAFTPEKQVKRWVSNTAATIDLTPSKEVTDTSPKPNTAEPATDEPSQTDSTVLTVNPTDKTSDALSDTSKDDTDVNNDSSHGLSSLPDPSPIVADSVDDELDDCDEALVAEQQVVLSQAASFGFNRFAQGQAQQHKTDTPTVVVNHDSSEANPTDSPMSASSDTDYQQDGFSADVDGYSFSDYQQDDDYQPSDHDDYVAFSAQHESYQADSPVDYSTSHLQNQALLDTQPHTEPKASQAKMTSESGDALDFLNVVLATRDSLIKDLGALQQKEAEAAKAPVTIKSTKIPNAAKPTATVDTPNMGNSSAKAPDAVVDECETLQDTNSHRPELADTLADDDAEVSHSLGSDHYDRPPWVKPGAGEQVTPFTDAVLPAEILSQELNSTSNTTITSQIIDVDSAKAAELPSNQKAVVTSATPSVFKPHRIEGHELDLHWYKVMTNVSVGGRVRQLGVNAVCQGQSNSLILVLKPDQKHLSAPQAVDQLQVALTDYLQQPIEVKIEIGVVPQRETPLELRKRFHRELIAQAEQSILQDDNTQWMIQRLSAQLDSDSIEYPPEQLAQIAEDIAQISVQ